MENSEADDYWSKGKREIYYRRRYLITIKKAA
jgi:hypothetical protein